VTEEDIRNFQKKYDVCPGQKIIGLGARLATEKGVEYLVEAMPIVLQKFPNARVLSYGQYQNVVGEEAYSQKLMPLIKSLGEHWTFLGVISDSEVSAFFHTCHVTVLPSINSTESFGMVQVESMTCGTPVVDSDLPGIRQPILDTKMGRIVPPRDPKALAEAIISVLGEGDRYRSNAAEIAMRFSPQSTAADYEAIFKELLNSNGKR
jgi:glycosyltransferase involved in cell wall biosynthesis